MQTVIDLAQEEVSRGGLPFAAVVVSSQGEVVAQAVNTVAESNDPTDHAEIKALRMATKKIKSSTLSEYDVYAIGHPCPMCLEALKLARPRKVYFALNLKDKNKFFKQTRNTLALEQIPAQKKQALDVFKSWSKTKR